LEYIGWKEAAKAIEQAMEKLFMSNRATIDLARFMENGKTLSTTTFAEELLNTM